jgi:hypothetical protein
MDDASAQYGLSPKQHRREQAAGVVPCGLRPQAPLGLPILTRASPTVLCPRAR